jgi:2-keto-3-deoxygluconate permease
VTTAILLPLYIAFLVKRLERKGFLFDNNDLIKKEA